MAKDKKTAKKSKIDFALLPRTTIIGRVTNRLNLMKTRRGVPYLEIFIYLYHNGNAKLCPVRVFNKLAKKMIKCVHQGDLLNINARIDIMYRYGYSHGNKRLYFDPYLIGSSFTFLEPKDIRAVYNGKTGKSLKVLFPVNPSNYPFKNKPKQKPKPRPKLTGTSQKPDKDKKVKADRGKKVSKHKMSAPNQKHGVKEVDVKVLPKKSDHKRSKTSSKSRKSSQKNGDWMSKISHLGDHGFPKMS